MIDRDLLIPAGADAVTQHGRLLFRYYKDRYAAMLLEDLLQSSLPIRSLRESRYGRLLERPAIKALIASKGDGWLDRDDLLMLWPCEVESYVLTFAVWGSNKSSEQFRYQTSRPCRQLALQLNFSGQHDAQYRRLIRDSKKNPFFLRSHPVNRKGRNTLAWARIDIDWHSGEALIDEVQSDWIGRVELRLTQARRGYGPYWRPAARERLEIYANRIVAPHAAMWSEALLSATLHVLVREFGINRVWFHDFETGCEIKRLKQRRPPRALYTDLPRRFCFERTDEPPKFILAAQAPLLQRKLKRRKGRFWRFDALPLPVRQ